jgi:hypothetical protein
MLQNLCTCALQTAIQALYRVLQVPGILEICIVLNVGSYKEFCGQ